MTAPEQPAPYPGDTPGYTADEVVFKERPAQPAPYPGDAVGTKVAAPPRFADPTGRPLSGHLNARGERDSSVLVAVVDGVLDDLPAGTYRLTGILRGPSGAHMIAETVTL